jgi:hypothetical protein
VLLGGPLGAVEATVELGGGDDDVAGVVAGAGDVVAGSDTGTGLEVTGAGREKVGPIVCATWSAPLDVHAASIAAQAIPAISVVAGTMQRLALPAFTCRSASRWSTAGWGP